MRARRRGEGLGGELADEGCRGDSCDLSGPLAIDLNNQQPDPEPEPDGNCTDPCGDGGVYLCHTPHAPYSQPETLCIDPQDSQAFLQGSYGYCGQCEPQEPCPQECGEGSLAGYVVCTDAYGENGGPQTICKQGSLVSGEYCGPCEQEQDIPK